ncbi:zinc ribbon domain-containing protein [Mesorhizobium sp. M1216]|uniref:zinc ribbon domain-containing protein n=1 Tax=Mesorhizobium sp. M1216 TaxID=2957069 RepID=UPI00333BBF0E
MTCARCGCAVVAEIKKGKYIYYHCTGHSDKGRGGYAECRRKYVREEVLEEAFGRSKPATPMSGRSRNGRSCDPKRNTSDGKVRAVFRQPFDYLQKQP